MGHASAAQELTRAGFTKRFEYTDYEWDAFGGAQILKGIKKWRGGIF
jgi:hypothetical protein